MALAQIRDIPQLGIGYGVAYLHQGRCQEAMEALEAVVAVEPDHQQAAANLSVAYNTAGQPDNPSVVLNLGFACQDTGLIERAVECLNLVVTSMPDTSYAQKTRQALSVMQRTVP